MSVLEVRPNESTFSIHQPRMLAGTLVVAFILAFSRWGTQINFASLFISDVLIALSLVHLFTTRFLKGYMQPLKEIRGRVTKLFALFLAFVLFRFLLSFGQSSLYFWLRDGVPYLYAFLALLSAYSFARTTKHAHLETVRIFRWALSIHLGWLVLVSVFQITGGVDTLGPFSEEPAFSYRGDYDAAIIGITAALNVRQLLLGRRIFWNTAGLLLAIYVVATILFHSRAGLLSILVALIVATFFGVNSLNNRKLKLVLTVLLIPLVALVTVLAVLQTPAGQRLLSIINPSLVNEEALIGSGQGTANARSQVWGAVIAWSNENTSRMLLGGGFGNNFLDDAGVLQIYEGTTYDNVRGAHNWFVGTYARLGVVGATLSLFWIIQMVHIIWMNRKRFAASELQVFMAVIFFAFLPVATLGVILEAPFGAILFFWAAGILMASRSAEIKR